MWALVAGTVVGQLATVIGYMLAAPWRFHFSLRWRVARPLLGYSSYLLAVAILAFLMVNLDDFVVGYVWKATLLGDYAVACAFGYIPMTLISGPAGGALFPSFVRVQNDLVALRQGFLESFSYAVAIIAPAGIGLAVIAPELVRIVLGDKWIAATLPLVILSFYGLSRALMDFSNSLFSAVGRPKLVAKLNLHVVLLSAIGIWPLTAFGGITGAAVAMTIPVVIVLGISIVWTGRVLQVSAWTVPRGGRVPYIAAAVMGVLVVVVRFALYAILPPRIAVFGGLSMASATVVFLVVLPLGIVTYTMLVRLLDRELFDNFWRNLGLAVKRTPTRPLPVDDP